MSGVKQSGGAWSKPAKNRTIKKVDVEGENTTEDMVKSAIEFAAKKVTNACTVSIGCKVMKGNGIGNGGIDRSRRCRRRFLCVSQGNDKEGQVLLRRSGTGSLLVRQRDHKWIILGDKSVDKHTKKLLENWYRKNFSFDAKIIVK